METTISVPEETLHRVDDAARRLGVSRGEFFAHAAERWMKALDDDTTATINGVITGLPADHAFTDAAASALIQDDRD
ncbi:ribbon-helix-helix protein, CopG family [Conexibacter arvalis]|uniref:Metal-responsive CopG/Arc/MetJ family transcriptional regulator n=1 Tax=Conexibacter arvalis TaxID=912552 RepID=A0A840IFZ7_9ACTN|nr:ribbon-helix-helix protein, CopG family [Conexibacter arvalis]MBB4663937.1 metal-responsive CopG/Arc/MetJ family transcriptional regulator [Conexibacter arvalis]